ncbi:MAG: hypothetical protein LBH84_00705 [Prevotellaceae bacterium]|nr:hypothetical protein [Prevotellaceae bacterium]
MLVFIPDDSDMGIDDIKDGEEYIIYGKGYTHSDAKPQGVLPSFWRIRKKVASMAAV